MHLLAVRRDGTVIEIGTVISDLGGFRYGWTSPDADLYTITAHFAGDDSYGSSWTATGLSVGPAPPPPVEAPVYTGIDLAIIAAVVVVAILVLYDIVRKLRK